MSVAAASPEPSTSVFRESQRVKTPDIEREDTEKFMKWKALKAREMRKQRLMEAKRKHELAVIAEEAKQKQVRTNGWSAMTYANKYAVVDQT